MVILLLFDVTGGKSLCILDTSLINILHFLEAIVYLSR